MTAVSNVSAPPGLLGDTTARDYSEKLKLFNAFAEPELRQALAMLELRPGMRCLDAGCGTGEALQWLQDGVGPGGTVVGIDLATAHVAAARRRCEPGILPVDTLDAPGKHRPQSSGRPGIQVLQADLLDAPLPPASFDVIWCVNTLNHVRDRLSAVSRLAQWLRDGGRIAVGQSAFLPDMVFAWDSRLERLTNQAVRLYYRDRYGLAERDLTAVRALVGVLREAGLRDVKARTFVIERLAPVGPADRDYLLEAIFRQTWGGRLRPYLSAADFAQLGRLCDPAHAEFALHRPDFHFIQTFTLVVGTAAEIHEARQK
jgi:SAM-dependent methyltransferase